MGPCPNCGSDSLASPERCSDYACGRSPVLRPLLAGPVPAPQRPALTSAMQFGLGPKFLLLSSAPASGGFMAEAVGTCQGSPLRFDR